MSYQAYAMFIYALLLFIGGYIGYHKSGSIPSLAMGSTFGLLSLITAIAMLQGKKWGWMGAVVLGIFLTLFFGYRLYATYRFMPAGLFTILSLALTTFLLLKKISIIEE